MNEHQLDLLHRYLDGAITPEELPSLEELLRNSETARATLRSLATIDAKWQELATDEGFGQTRTSLVTRSVSEGPSAGSSHKDRPALKFRVASLLAIAASLIFAAIGWFRSPEELAGPGERGIARVIRIEGECRVDQTRMVTDGSELFAGEDLAMQRGLIELAFRETGVHVIATAPLSLKLNSDQRVRLNEGQVKLVVPPQGVGFVVDTAERKFVDLGTSFVVTAGDSGSEVLVLDGLISVDDHDGGSEGLMHEGEFAKYGRDGKLNRRSMSNRYRTLPELALEIAKPKSTSLRGVVLGFDGPIPTAKNRLVADVMGHEMLPLIQSGFRDRSCMSAFKQGEPLSFRGIAGAYHEFPDRSGLASYSRAGGWMAWYRGKVIPPATGRYRFWGYADNHLLVAINGKPVFDGSRSDSALKELGIRRTDNPALPCLIAPAGFACGEWIETSGESVQLDILFGERSGNTTSGLLLVEREGDTYEETFWGQPKWPLFLTETPRAEETAEFKRLVDHLEQRTMGSFSVSEEAVWRVEE